MARDRAPSFGALVDERLRDPAERIRPALLRDVEPKYRADRLLELGADLADAVEAHARPAGAHGKVGDDVVRAAALAVAVEAAQVWLATTGWPDTEGPGGS